MAAEASRYLQRSNGRRGRSAALRLCGSAAWYCAWRGWCCLAAVGLIGPWRRTGAPSGREPPRRHGQQCWSAVSRAMRGWAALARWSSAARPLSGVASEMVSGSYANRAEPHIVEGGVHSPTWLRWCRAGAGSSSERSDAQQRRVQRIGFLLRAPVVDPFNGDAVPVGVHGVIDNDTVDRVSGVGRAQAGHCVSVRGADELADTKLVGVHGRRLSVVVQGSGRYQGIRRPWAFG